MAKTLLKKLIHTAAFVGLIGLFYLAGSGNWIFDSIYLWWSDLQLILIVAFVFFLPFYVRYIIQVR